MNDNDFMDKSNITLESRNNIKDNILLAQIRECFGRVAYSHKTHEKQAEILANKDKFWKCIQIILSVVVSGTFLATLNDLFNCEKLWVFLGTILSIMLAAINLLFNNFNYGKESQKHKDIAVKLWNIRETYISLIADLMAKSIVVESAIKKRDDLQSELMDIYKNAPQTSKKAYAEAQKALKLNEELTFSSSELDMLLPNKLRLIAYQEVQ